MKASKILNLFRKPFVWIILLITSLSGLFYVKYIHTFLCFSQPVNTQTMLVEGWLNNYALEIASKEYKDNNYKLLLTTGGKLPEFYKMSETGGLVFCIEEIPQLPDNIQISDITLECYGYKALGSFPHVNIRIDEKIVSSFTVGRMKKDYHLKLPEKLAGFKRLIIEYPNDAYDTHSDRNLVVSGLHFNDIKLELRGKGRYFDRGLIDGIDLIKVNAHDFAFQSAGFIHNCGVADSSLIPISPGKAKINRTLNNALAVANWINHSKLPIKSINILSFDTHARRSLLVYRKVLPHDIEIGIIAIRNYSYDPARWWRRKSGIKAVMYESLAYLYYLILLQFH